MRPVKVILDYHRTVFDPDIGTLYAGTREALRDLSAKYELFLISMHEPEREAAANKLDIGRYFRSMFFVDKKSPALFEAIAKTKATEEKAEISPASNNDNVIIVVVGDSIHNEIAIGNRLGYATVRFRRGKFAGQIPTNNDEHADF